MVTGKRGWIRIVEAFMAILLITGIALTIIGTSYIRKSEQSAEIYILENIILKEIELEDALRTDILGVNIGDDVPQSVINKIDEETPGGFDCSSKICSIDDSCILETDEENVYARSAIISSDLITYSPRQLKIFCWKKN